MGNGVHLKNKGQEFKVGLLFIVTLVILAYFAVKVGSLKMPWQKEGYIVNVYFDNIAGLEEKSPVRLAGVRVGFVRSISLVKGKAHIVIEINHGIEIQKDATVNVAQMGIMGEKFLEIVRGSPNSASLKNGDVLNGAPPTSFGQVISVVNSIGHDIKSITSSLKKTLASKEGEKRLTLIFKNLERMTSDLSQILESNQSNIHLSVNNVKELTESLKQLIAANSEQLSATVESIKQLSETLADKAPAFVDKLDTLATNINNLLPKEGDSVQVALHNIKDATEDLKSTISSMKDITSKINNGKGTIGKLINDDQTHRKLNTALGDLDKTLNEARNVLGRVNNYETMLGYRAEYLGQNDAWKHFISLKIKPRDDKYYLVEIVDSPYGYLTETTTHTFITTTDSETGTTTEEILKKETKTEDKFLINLQVAKEFHNLTFRAGLIETHGGFGLDLGFWDKNILFSMDTWDFGRDDLHFHLKFSARFKFYHGLYLSGGWDDVLNDSIDSYFIGAGVLFTDEDLKYLLGIAATASSSL